MKKKILIVSANYYKDISKSLLTSAKTQLTKINLKIKIIEVPGIFEVPVTIVKNINKYDGFIALGCVIQGQTPHFKFISKSVTDSIMNISVKHKKPIGNGILTCLDKRQAKARSGSFNKVGKGTEAAKAVLSVLNNF